MWDSKNDCNNFSKIVLMNTIEKVLLGLVVLFKNEKKVILSLFMTYFKTNLKLYLT